MCELLVGLPEINVLGVVDRAGDVLRVHIETRVVRTGCGECGVVARVKGRPMVELVDLPAFGRQTRLVWHKRRWSCLEESCTKASWTEKDTRIGAARMALSDRAGRWVTEQVGRYGRTVNEIAVELGCDWHTVNDTVIAYGTPLVNDPGRFGVVEALGLDEVLMVRVGPWHRQEFSTQIVDVGRGQLLDIVLGRKSAGPMGWLANQGKLWRDQVQFGTLDLSGPYRKVFTLMLPDAVQVADPFHVIKLSNTKLDQCRRRVQNETLGHRGHKSDPLYRCRRLLVKAEERLTDAGKEKLLGLLRAGDPKGDVATMWQAKEAVRELYAHGDPDVALQWVTELGRDLQDKDYPTEAQSLGRTLIRWKHQIAAWHTAHVSNGPTEAVNNLIKRVKRAAFGFTSFRNYRIRSLLYAGKPNWGLLSTVKPL
ncbi:MAG TPA: ISL3 family transposase [Acidimicrobiales bacterium]|jgi:transposase|nr:ISL3 family transposase [Acidimicrobiales bacterium]